MTICDGCPILYSHPVYTFWICGLGCIPTDIGDGVVSVEDGECPLDHIVLKDGTIYTPEVEDEN